MIATILGFKYKKDSVMEVSKRDYKGCDSSWPNLYSNTGNTVYALNRSGFFYFISGSTGHCELGQRMIVWVIEQDGSGETLRASNSNTLNNNAFFSCGFLLIILVFHFFSHQTSVLSQDIINQIITLCFIWCYFNFWIRVRVVCIPVELCLTELQQISFLTMHVLAILVCLVTFLLLQLGRNMIN